MGAVSLRAVTSPRRRYQVAGLLMRLRHPHSTFQSSNPRHERLVVVRPWASLECIPTIQSACPSHLASRTYSALASTSIHRMEPHGEGRLDQLAEHERET